MPTHEILVLTVYAQKLPTNAHPGVPSGASGLNYDLSLPLYQYMVYASSKICAFAQVRLSLRCSKIQLGLKYHVLDHIYVLIECILIVIIMLICR